MIHWNTLSYCNSKYVVRIKYTTHNFSIVSELVLSDPTDNNDGNFYTLGESIELTPYGNDKYDITTGSKCTFGTTAVDYNVNSGKFTVSIILIFTNHHNFYQKLVEYYWFGNMSTFLTIWHNQILQRKTSDGKPLVFLCYCFRSRIDYCEESTPTI